ncbi:NYN domain-containing protein [Candidatus Parcubacteria bacterium]|nr:MAG: NYN domain-containing protein [Candidatus Parcubacteria bacterium]
MLTKFVYNNFMLEKFVTGKAAVLIDAANLSKSVEGAGFKVNYRKLRRFFQKDCNLVYLGFYTVAFSSKVHQEFLKALKAKQYTIVTKPLKVIWDHKNSQEVHKANFDYLIRRLNERGKRVLVFSTRFHVAKELIGSCDKYFDILKLKQEFLTKR